MSSTDLTDTDRRAIREARLPAWARRELDTLRRALAARDRELAALSGEAGTEDTDTRVGVRGTLEHRPLPRGASIRYSLPVPDGARATHDAYYVDVATGEDGLVAVYASHRLLIEPRGANCCYLLVRDH